MSLGECLIGSPNICWPKAIHWNAVDISVSSCCLDSQVSVKESKVVLLSQIPLELRAVSISRFCLFNVLSTVLLQRNLCFISDQLLVRETSNDHRHALFQGPLCFYFPSMFDGIVWWSAYRRRRWLGRCHKVCNNTIICCFLWMYRSVQFKHCIGSLPHYSSLCALLYMSFLLLNRECN